MICTHCKGEKRPHSCGWCDGTGAEPGSLLARLIDYRNQVQRGFRSISRKDEMDLVQEAIEALKR